MVKVMQILDSFTQPGTAPARIPQQPHPPDPGRYPEHGSVSVETPRWEVCANPDQVILKVPLIEAVLGLFRFYGWKF